MRALSDRSSVLERLFSLAGKTVLVTGAAGGIGRELAAGMAEAGAIVALYDLDLDRLEEPLRRIQAVDGQVVPFAAALDDPRASADTIFSVFGTRPVATAPRAR
jgi:NAD(P)-dependent dehydrogenase (short-subunit alcohol dehydrogenase family)